MDFVIVNKDGQIYAGYIDGEPAWRRARRSDMQMSEELAHNLVGQLTALGFSEIRKRDVNELVRKWVPRTLDATMLVPEPSDE